MGLIFGLIKRLVKVAIYFGVFIAAVVLIPNLPPFTKFSSIPIEPTQPRVGPLAPNEALNNPEKLYQGKLLGPEAFEIYKGELYTSLATGEIVKISPGGHVTFVTKIGQPCTGLNQEHKCGRPLGFKIDEKNNMLYVADAYHGIWKVDLKTDKKQLLVSPRVEIEGRKPKFFNSIALAKNGDFYWTDSSSDFDLKDGAYTLMTDPSGRLFHYIASKNQSRVLLDNIWFANGVVLSPDNQFLVVSETCRFRLMKYYIDGPKKGKSEVFVAGLPGAPDNLRVLPDGSGLIAALYTSFDDQNPLLSKTLAETPIVRKFIARMQRLIEIPFEFLNTQFPHVIFDDIVYNIGHFKTVSSMTPGISGFVQLDWNGEIVSSYYNYDGSLHGVSDVIVYNDKLLTGAPHGQDFIGAVPAPESLKKAFASKSQPRTETKPKVEKPVEKSKVEPKVETPKPRVEEKREAPKPQEKQAKPVETVKVKPVEQPKPTEAPKPKPTQPPTTTTTPKPATKKPEEKPKTTTPAPKAETKTTPKVETKTTPKVETKPTPKVETKTTPKVETKPTETKPEKDATKPTTPKPAAETKPSEPKTEKEVKREIPIKEEIPTDTVKPSKEKLKVIKKDGPAEIPNPYLIEPTQPRVGPLAPNEALNNPEKLYQGKLLGPEAFDIYRGELYTSLATGEIVKISSDGHVTFVTKIGEPCTGLNQEHKCGRPLGFQIDEKNNMLYLADAYHGIWKVDLKNDKKQLLVSPRVEIERRKPKLFNSIALAKNGDFYWTDSSSDFELKDGAYTLMTDPSGRLFHYIASKNQSKVLLDNIWFANGVVLSPDNQFLLVAETYRFRLMKYYVDGPKKGKSEVFVAGLPGTPDKLRVLPDGSGLIAALYASFDDHIPLLAKTLPETPIVRKFIARMQRLIEIPFEFLNKQFPHVIFEDIVYNIGHFKSVSSMTPGISGLVQLDWNGEIISSYYNYDGTLPAISDVIVYNDKLLTGAPHDQDFIGAVPAPESLKKAFAAKSQTKFAQTKLKVEKPAEDPKA